MAPGSNAALGGGGDRILKRGRVGLKVKRVVAF